MVVGDLDPIIEGENFVLTHTYIILLADASPEEKPLDSLHENANRLLVEFFEVDFALNLEDWRFKLIQKLVYDYIVIFTILLTLTNDKLYRIKWTGIEAASHIENSIKVVWWTDQSILPDPIYHALELVLRANIREIFLRTYFHFEAGDQVGTCAIEFILIGLHFEIQVLSQVSERILWRGHAFCQNKKVKYSLARRHQWLLAYLVKIGDGQGGMRVIVFSEP